MRLNCSPKTTRDEVLDEIHEAHLDKSKANTFVCQELCLAFNDCPSLSCCSTCNAFTNRQLRRLYISMQFQDNLDRIDLFEYDGQTSLLVTNLYSKYFEKELLCQNTASCTRNKRERCQRQRTTEEQHQIIVLQKP